jgi:ABC-type multidrug transport system fused ATPase/permease subunit
VEALSTDEEGTEDECEVASGDVVQFASSIYVADLKEDSDSDSQSESGEQRRALCCPSRIKKAGTVQVDVMRIGPLRGDISVSYYTTEVSAVSGKHYEHRAGVINMADGQSMDHIHIGLLNDGKWNATLEFNVVLDRPQNCQLGRYLKVTRVKRVDGDCFPSNDFQASIDESKTSGTDDSIQDIHGMALFRAFLVTASTSADGAKWMMIASFFLGLLDILYAYLFMTLQVFLVDHVLNTKEKSHSVNTLIGDMDRHAASIAIVSAMLSPLIVLYLARLAKAHMDLEGLLTHWLKCSIYRKYLNLTEEMRLTITPSDCVVRIDRDVETVCSAVTTYIDCFLISCRIIMFFVFTIMNAPDSWFICISMVLCVVLVASLRQTKRGQLETDVGNKETALNGFVTESLHHIQLIAYCSQRPKMNQEFSKFSQDFRDTNLPLVEFGINNESFKEWLNKGFVAIYIVIGARSVLDGTLSLGAFVTMINVINDTGANLEALWDALITVSKAYAPLKDLTFLLNSKIYLTEASKHANAQATTFRRMTLTGAALEVVRTNESRFDAMPIEIKIVSFKYGEVGPNLLEDVSVIAKQGSIVQIVGGDATCKRTILHLLSSLIYPTEGEVVIPTHIRTMFVSDTPDMLKRSLWDNLVFACSHKPDPKRILNIVDKLQMPVTRKIIAKEILDKSRHVTAHEMDWARKHDDGADGCHKLLNWEILPKTEMLKMNLARALIMNPECLIVSKPFSTYVEKETKELISNIIVEHNNKRGVAMEGQKDPPRRPRTVFVTASHGDQKIPGAVVWATQSKSGSRAGPFTVDSGASRAQKVSRFSTAPPKL